MQIGATAVHLTRPYMTTAMLRAKGTGLALDGLVPSGTPQQQTDALADKIREASAEMDAHCYGMDGVLHATVDTETARARLDAQGCFRITPRLTPVRALTALSYAAAGAGGATAVTDFSGAEVDVGRIIVPGGVVTGLGTLQFGGGAPAGEFRVTYSYVNGWPLALLTADVTPGSPVLHLDDVTGVFEGSKLRIRDGLAADETVTVTAVAGNEVTVESLAHGHTAGAQVDGLPDVLIDACTEIVTGLLKRKSQEGVRPQRTAARGQQGRHRRPPIAAGEHHFARGLHLLAPFVRPF